MFAEMEASHDWALKVEESPSAISFVFGSHGVKRLFDLLVSVITLVVCSPLLLCIGILVASTSSGGPLFRQKRIGLQGQPFFLLKFRTMTVQTGAEDGAFDAGSDTRVTRVGRILRATKLDELPQFWNVLRGDMSLVGPRPEVEAWTRFYPDRWTIVHTVRPGITDEASIEFRDEERILSESSDAESCYRDVVLPRKLDLAEAYVRSRSFGGDLLILWRTFCAILAGGRTHGNT